MELLKKNIRMTWQKAKAVTQITLEEDRNVPDSRPDTESIIQTKGVVRLEEVKSSQGQIHIVGYLEVHILYTAENEAHTLHRLETKLPFDEMLNMEEAQAGDSIDLEKEIEDLNVHLINSRKLSIQAVVTFRASISDLYDAQAAVELHGVENLGTKTREIRPLSLTVQTRDILRVREEIPLASNKPNIGEILWENVQLRGDGHKGAGWKAGRPGRAFCVCPLQRGRRQRRETVDGGRPAVSADSGAVRRRAVQCPGCGNRSVPALP